MDEKGKRTLLVAAGKELLEKRLVARTWGNISCRLDSGHCLITPSGLDYLQTREEDIVKINIDTEQWEGLRKPSGERGVHIAAYRCFSEAEFVIHTHQKYATAIGLTGLGKIDITEEERAELGGIGIAGYGLPGMKKLTNAVNDVLQQGIETVLMVHHGALICGRSRDEAMKRAALLEEICRRNIRAAAASNQTGKEKRDIREVYLDRKLRESESIIKQRYRYADVFRTEAVGICADKGKPIYAQLDDMAQMIGKKIPAADTAADAAEMLRKYQAVLIRGIGAAVRADTADDAEALKLLTDKSCLCEVHTAAHGAENRIGAVDTALMHFVYKHKYSKQKDREES